MIPAGKHGEHLAELVRLRRQVAAVRALHCHECLPWHVEVSRDIQTGDPRVVEWHAVDCPVVKVD